MRRRLVGGDRKRGTSTLMDTSCRYPFTTVFSIKTSNVLDISLCALQCGPITYSNREEKGDAGKRALSLTRCQSPAVGVTDKPLALI